MNITNTTIRQTIDKEIENELNNRNTNQIEALLTEKYVEKIAMQGVMPYTKNWWICWHGDKKIAIHIENGKTKSIDFKFAKVLQENGVVFRTIFIEYNTTNCNIQYFYNNEYQDLDYIEKEFNLSKRQHHYFNNNSNNIISNKLRRDIIKWFYRETNILEFYFETKIQNEFINTYFKKKINLDLVLFDIEEQNFYVVETKRKTNNKKGIYQINDGEFRVYKEIKEKINNIKVCFIMMITRKNQENINHFFSILLNNKDVSLFYHIPTKEDFHIISQNFIESKNDTEDKETTITYFIPFGEFLYTNSLEYIKTGFNNKEFLEKTIHNIIIDQKIQNEEIKDPDKKIELNSGFYKKHIRKTIILCLLSKYGYDVRYQEYIDIQNFASNVLKFNEGQKDVNVLFKGMENWSLNCLLTEEELNNLTTCHVEYIMCYRLKRKYSVNKQEEYSLVEQNNEIIFSYNIKGDDIPYDIFIIKAKDFIEHNHLYVAKKGEKPNQTKMNLVSNGKLKYEHSDSPNDINFHFLNITNKTIDPTYEDNMKDYLDVINAEVDIINRARIKIERKWRCKYASNIENDENGINILGFAKHLLSYQEDTPKQEQLN